MLPHCSSATARQCSRCASRRAISCVSARNCRGRRPLSSRTAIRDTRTRVSSVKVNDTIHDFYGFHLRFTPSAVPHPVRRNSLKPLPRCCASRALRRRSAATCSRSWCRVRSAMYPDHDIPALQLAVRRLGPSHQNSAGNRRSAGTGVRSIAGHLRRSRPVRVRLIRCHQLPDIVAC